MAALRFVLDAPVTPVVVALQNLLH